MSELRDKIRNQTVGYIMAAFGLVAGLAWNDAIKGFIDYLYPIGKDGLPAKFIYAVMITLIVVLISWYINRDDQK
jgi:hypothetical protein